MKLVGQNLIKATYDKDGNLGSWTKTQAENGDLDGYDCHGLTFTDNRLWINNEEVDKLLANENAWRDVSEEAATGVIFKEGGQVVHSALRNSDGTYDDNAGFLTTQCGRNLQEASRGFTDTSNKANTEFFLHMGNTILNTDLGTVKDGVRTITDPEDIKKLFGSN